MRKLFILGIIITFLIILGGCFKGEQTLEEIDVPNETEVVDQLDEVDGKNKEAKTDNETEESVEMVEREVYLIDVNGNVVPQTVEIPKIDSKEVATQALEYLVKDGPITPILPNGFQAVLPAGTEILGLNLQEDGTLIVDVSEEFKNYEAKDELKILQAMTYTLTQFENVDNIKLRINGQEINEMPVNETPIANGYSRSNGINIIQSDATDLLNSQAVTMYYPTEHNDYRYYVPITRHIETNKDEDIYEAIVQALIDGPGYDSNTVHVFNMETELKNKPTLKDGTLELVFNKNILQDDEKAVISDEVMETIVRTLTEQDHVEAVTVKVEDVEQINNENGEAYNKPVTKNIFKNKKM